MAEPTTEHPITFAELGLRPELLDTLATLGYEEPTPIQATAIPVLLQGQRHARASRHRNGKDGSVRPPDPATASRPRARPRSPWH